MPQLALSMVGYTQTQQNAVFWVKLALGGLLVVAGIWEVIRQAPAVSPNLVGQSWFSILGNVVQNQPLLPTGIIMIILGMILIGVPAADIAKALYGDSPGAAVTPTATPT